MATLAALCFDAQDPARLASFWATLLAWDPSGGVTLRPTDDTGFHLRFVPSGAPKTAPNRMHFDLTSSSLADQQQTVERALSLGARHIDVGQLPEEPHVVLADPEGNEFCVVEPGNNFLADCGFLGAVSCDGSRAMGQFWSEALAWPLVWDQNEETAIRSRHGGPKISWGGPPIAPKQGANRVRFALTGVPEELDRLLALGATRAGDFLADPDGNEFELQIA